MNFLTQQPYFLCLKAKRIQYIRTGGAHGWQLYSMSAVLMDGDTGRILYEKNGHEKRAMASTTKIMTLILTLEYGNLDDIVTVGD